MSKKLKNTKFVTIRNQLLAVCKKEFEIYKFDLLREERKSYKIMQPKS